MSIQYDLSTEFSGGQAPAGTPPWVTAVFDDSFGGPNTVRLTVSTSELIGDEFLTQFYANFDPTLDPAKLGVALITSPVFAVGVSKAVNLYKADEDGYYDILFDFAGSDKFTAGETFVIDMTYDSPITAASFDFFDSGGNKGDFYVAAKVQGKVKGIDDDGSGWIGDGHPASVPEPSATILLGLGLFAMGTVGRLASRKR